MVVFLMIGLTKELFTISSSVEGLDYAIVIIHKIQRYQLYLLSVTTQTLLPQTSQVIS